MLRKNPEAALKCQCKRVPKINLKQLKILLYNYSKTILQRIVFFVKYSMSFSVINKAFLIIFHCQYHTQPSNFAVWYRGLLQLLSTENDVIVDTFRLL